MYCECGFASTQLPGSLQQALALSRSNAKLNKLCQPISNLALRYSRLLSFFIRIFTTTSCRSDSMVQPRTFSTCPIRHLAGCEEYENADVTQ
ncbi:unnamed protein product [Cylicocyclus nassatus]|uniref:Uncharacterized protein n=1 Tax=Cylicocyclus nassatus TaxID=53992 RepID=A0AA36M800_CYLNA|nr:unnamed protein product [Cylicocyclus nassatus]